MSISRRIFISILGLTALVLVVTLGAARWSFERGFADYVNALEHERLRQLSVEFADLYVANGSSWTPELGERLTARLHAWRPPGEDAMPALHNRLEPRPEPVGRPRGDRRPLRGGIHAPPTAVYDVDGNWVAGTHEIDAGGNAQLYTVRLRDGAVIGELRSRPRRVLDSPRETAFARQQRIASVVIGVFALALSAGLAWALASALVAPMRQVAAGVRALSDGDYSERLTPGREDELGVLIDDVNHLARTLELGRESRQRWIASISHELRTPLTILLGELQALRDGIRPLDLEALESLAAEADRMNRLVEDLYQMSVTDLGGLRYEWAEVGFTQLVDDVLGSLRDDDGVGFDVEIPSEVDVRGDVDRLTQLLLNLGTNSIAYTDSPATRRARVFTQPGCVHLVVEDSAPGVDADSCARLFEPLFRMDESRSRRTGGAGLGMAICKNIVEAHGGTIEASPSELGGLRVEVALPLEKRSM